MFGHAQATQRFPAPAIPRSRTSARSAAKPTDRRFSDSKSSDRDALDARRRELAALLEEIRDPSPRPQDILQAVQEAAGGLCQDRLGRIEARITALYEAG